ncbi:EEV maturation protein [Hypsugopox virus]|nr:EEV maturation protein [Hypsugopox virus]
MFTLLSKICEEDKQDIITPTLNEHKGSIVLARTTCGSGIIIHEGNVNQVKIVTDLEKLEIVAVTENVAPKNYPLRPITKLFIDEVNDINYYFPKTTPTYAYDILCKRANDIPEIKIALEKYPLKKESSIIKINEWLCKHHLYKYRFINYKDERCNNNSLYTFVDEFIITYIGHHAIWVKNKSYSRPEIDILPYNVKNLEDDSNWTKLFSYNKQFLRMFSITINAMITSSGPSIYMITVYPGCSFINFNTKKLITDFLKWLKDAMTNVNSITLVGFMSSFFGFPLLKASWPAHCGWKFVSDDCIISDDGLKVFLVDVAKFACKLSFTNYCEKWENKSVNYPKDLITKQEAKFINKSIEKVAVKATTILYNAVNAQISFLNTLLSPLSMTNFNRIEDMFFTRVLSTSAIILDKHIYYPVSSDAINFVHQAIRPQSILTINKIQPKSYDKYKLKSILDIIANGKYPSGKPKFVKTVTDNKLYIALCEVSIKNNLKIPVVFMENVHDSCYTFNTILTSVDIELARKIGGCKIKEISALQWDETIDISFVMKETVSSIDKININETDMLLENLLEITDLFPYKENDNIPNNLLLFSAFAVSYCRQQIHSLIAKIDSHFLGDVVCNHNYKEFWVKEGSVNLLENIKTEITKLN